MHDFNEQCEFVRTTFFPAWDRKREWRFARADELDGSMGRCDRDRKEISVWNGIGGDHLTALLIHEVGHAATDDYHGKRWTDRMEKAAIQAQELCLGTVARLLREEINGYKDAFPMTASMVYDRLELAVFVNRSLTFTQIVELLRRDYGFTREQFLKRFRRAERVFEQAKRDAKAMAEKKGEVCCRPSYVLLRRICRSCVVKSIRLPTATVRLRVPKRASTLRVAGCSPSCSSAERSSVPLPWQWDAPSCPRKTGGS